MDRELNPPPGRPPEWPKHIETAKKYTDGGYVGYGHAIPSIAGLALVLGVERYTIHTWAKNVDEFKVIVDRLLANQEQALISNGLAGVFNSSITKLILTKHGYSDRQETALTGADGGPVEVRDVTRTIVDPKH